MNKVILIGNLTKDPDAKRTQSGIAVTTFSIAVNRKFSNQAGEREVDFFNIVTWRGLAENCAKYITKGKKVAVEGRLQTRSYDDANGIKRYITEVVAEDVQFLTPRGTSGDSGAYNAPPPPPPAISGPDKKANESKSFVEVDINDDDLPF